MAVFNSILAKEAIEDGLPHLHNLLIDLKRAIRHEVEHTVDTLPGVETLVEKAVIEAINKKIDGIYDTVEGWTK